MPRNSQTHSSECALPVLFPFSPLRSLFSPPQYVQHVFSSFPCYCWRRTAVGLVNNLEKGQQKEVLAILGLQGRLIAQKKRYIYTHIYVYTYIYMHIYIYIWERKSEGEILPTNLPCECVYIFFWQAPYDFMPAHFIWFLHTLLILSTF